MVFKKGRYSLNPDTETIGTYNYLNPPIPPHKYIHHDYFGAKTYEIAFSYSPLVDTYRF